MKFALLSFLFITIALPSAFAADVLIGRAFVIDGDTIEIKNQRIRLASKMRPSWRNDAGEMAGYILAASTPPPRSMKWKVGEKHRLRPNRSTGERKDQETDNRKTPLVIRTGGGLNSDLNEQEPPLNQNAICLKNCDDGQGGPLTH